MERGPRGAASSRLKAASLPPRKGGEVSHRLFIYLFYFAIALLITWPLVAQLGTHLVGWSYGDSHEMARHIWWYNHALRTGQPIFWQPALGYPDGMEGVLLWAHPQQFFPAWLLAFVLPIPAAANLSILLYMALTGWATYLLAMHLLDGRRGPALLAGLAFMAAPTFQGHLGGGHAGLMVAWPVPLYVLALFKLNTSPPSLSVRLPLSIGWRGGRGVRWFCLVVLFFVLSPGGHILQLIYALLPISGVFALAYLWRREWSALLRLIVVNAIGCAVLLIFVLPIARSTFETSAYIDEGGFVRYSADLLSVVSPSFFHPLYAWLEYPRRVLGTNLEEGTSYIGIIAGLLAIIGCTAFKRARLWLLLALVAWVLSLGPLLKILDVPVQVQSDGYASYVTLPFAALQNLPIFNLARTPGRFNFTLALAVAVLAGYGTAWLWDRIRDTRLRPALVTVLMAALLVDYQVYWPLPTHSAAIPDAVYALAERDDVRAVLDLPWNNSVAAKDALYLQTAHQKPLIAGHVTRSTPVSPAKLTLLEQTLDPALLDSAEADIVILHKAYIPDEQIIFTRTALGEPLYEDTGIALFESPSAEGTPEFTPLTSGQSTIERYVDSYLYAPQTGWVDFSGTLQADGREVELLLNQQVIQHWQVESTLDFHVPLPVEAGNYYVARLALNPPCPSVDDPALECRTVMVSNLEFSQPVAAESAAVTFDQGVRLLRGTVTQEPGETIIVRLRWAFDSARSANDIRFVHVVGADGVPIVQDDRTLGIQPAGSEWVETVTLALPDNVPAGIYRVYAGWYTYPDFVRFAVEGAPDGLALVDEVTIN
jgi:hypothetical protein